LGALQKSFLRPGITGLTSKDLHKEIRMKIHPLLMMILSFPLALTVCGPEASVKQITVSDVYTVVATTVAAQFNADHHRHPGRH
jgi:hypothetical protein